MAHSLRFDVTPQTTTVGALERRRDIDIGRRLGNQPIVGHRSLFASRIGIPAPQQLLSMFLDQPLNPPNLGGLEPSDAVQAR
jgi:hypothetical protein